ncbi:hypothetical protein H6B11_04490 [Mediterraneibacter glycyrrhizinilyticus]|nr:hypothetical protein [Mediterraneibacter glycyrrhizinilyticus]
MIRCYPNTSRSFAPKHSSGSDTGGMWVGCDGLERVTAPGRLTERFGFTERPDLVKDAERG